MHRGAIIAHPGSRFNNWVSPPAGPAAPDQRAWFVGRTFQHPRLEGEVHYLLLETAEFGLIRYSAVAVRSCTTGPNIKVKTAAAANNAAAVTKHPTKPPH